MRGRQKYHSKFDASLVFTESSGYSRALFFRRSKQARKVKKKKKDLFPNTCIGTEQKKNLMPTVKSIALEFSM
jgi:hypothetical protein